MSKDNKNKQTPYQSIVDIAEHIPNNELLKQLTAESDKKKSVLKYFVKYLILKKQNNFDIEIS